MINIDEFKNVRAHYQESLWQRSKQPLFPLMSFGRPWQVKEYPDKKN